MSQRWTSEDVVAWLAEQGRPITARSWRSYVARGQAPAPEEYVGRTPTWAPEQVMQWHERSKRAESSA